MTAFEPLVVIVGVAAGAVAAVAGFGVGSLLTPLLTPAYGAKRAVALVAIPHAIGTLLRLWKLRASVSSQVLKGFGLASALGGLAGAYGYTQVRGAWLARILGVLLVVVGVMQVAGAASPLRLPRRWAWLAGAVSGLLGGLVGNQGGVRSAGLLAFGLSSREFIATAAAIALIVDAVRLPIYLGSDGRAVAAAWPVVVAATVGVTTGTFVGTHWLVRLSDTAFRRVVGVTLLGLGAWLLVSIEQGPRP